MTIKTSTNIRKITVSEYHQIAEAGIFHPEERLELIAGQIINKSPQGTKHPATITRTQRILNQRLGDKVLIRTQSPVTLDNYSEPEPDIAIVKPHPLDYEDHHPYSSEVFLIIEIADTSLKFDREIKSLAYAKSGVIDYWVLDVNGHKLYVYRLPNAAGYQSEGILSENLTISPLAFPECEIRINELLRKVLI
ncbi:MAG TPA: Uma2 family endonuclease [Nostocaceae cyanobacterium]|nr:Uma2 family endonuclease [Nostocaceae cyanobacterium]